MTDEQEKAKTKVKEKAKEKAKERREEANPASPPRRGVGARKEERASPVGLLLEKEKERVKVRRVSQ